MGNGLGDGGGCAIAVDDARVDIEGGAEGDIGGACIMRCQFTRVCIYSSFRIV
jgi:hypothetical protein